MTIGMEHIKSLRELYEISQKMGCLIETNIIVSYESTDEYAVVRNTPINHILVDIRACMLTVLNSYYWGLKQVNDYKAFCGIFHGMSYMVNYMHKFIQDNKDIVKNHPNLKELYKLSYELKENALLWAIHLEEVYERR